MNLAELIAREDAFAASAVAARVSAEAWTGMYALRHAAELLKEASEGIAKGKPLDDLEMVRRFRWAAMKVIEFNGMLPEHLRGDLSYECPRGEGGTADGR